MVKVKNSNLRVQGLGCRDSGFSRCRGEASAPLKSEMCVG